LLPSAPPEVIVVVYRELAKRAHPDHGGDTASMQRINQAFADLKVRGAVGGGGR
jgi:curved DNA-binding protein CbpA